MSAPSAAPSATIAAAPLSTVSSAGWNTSRTRPRRRGANPASTSPTPSSVAVWMSCPHACIRPATVLANASPVCSPIGSASMSARISNVGPGAPPSISAVTPCPPTPVRGDRPIRRSSAATSPAVRGVSMPSSGCAWISRRTAINAGSIAATRLSSNAETSFTLSLITDPIP